MEGNDCRAGGKNVVFAACRNSLHKFQIPEEALLPCVRAVPAGVAELIRRQQEGFPYIKP